MQTRRQNGPALGSRLKSSEERNRKTAVAACPAGDSACCPVARATPPPEIVYDSACHFQDPVGEKADQDRNQDPLLTPTGTGGCSNTLQCRVYIFTTTPSKDATRTVNHY